MHSGCTTLVFNQLTLQFWIPDFAWIGSTLSTTVVGVNCTVSKNYGSRMNHAIDVHQSGQPIVLDLLKMWKTKFYEKIRLT